MALARALKNEMRASKPAKKGDISQGSPIKTKESKQFTFPKKTYNGPNYLQDEPQKGVVVDKGIMK